MCRFFRSVIAAFAATIFAILVFALSCSTSKGNAGNAGIAGQPPDLSPRPEFVAPEYTERTIGEVLSEIRNFGAPEGVDQSVFSMLKAELQRQIIALHGENESVRITSAAPFGEAGFAGDLALDADTGELVWSYANLGDYDLNGEVGISDITPIALNYLKKAIESNSIEAWIDGDGDGEIGIPDVTPIAMHYLNTVSQYRVYSSDSPDGGFEDSGVFIPFGQTGEFPKEFSFPISGFTERYFAVYPFAPGNDSQLIRGERSRIIDSLAPIPEISSVDPIYGSSGFGATFSAEAVGDEPLEFKWNFGGGAVPNSSRSTNPEVLLSEKGRYPAALFVSNGHIRKKFTFDLTVVERDGEVVSAWPMYGRDARNTRRSPYKGPDTPELKWKFRTFGPGYLFGPPAYGPDGTIYVGLSGGLNHGIDFGGREFWALYPDGSKKWVFPVGSIITSQPALTADGAVLFGCFDGYFYSLDLNGNLKWKFKTAGPCATGPALGPDGTIYFGSRDGSLYALNPDGSLKWSYETEGEVNSKPAISDAGTIFFDSQDKYIYALNPDGSAIWTYLKGREGSSNPVMRMDGTIVFADTVFLYSMSPDGELDWKVVVGGGNNPILSPDLAVGLDGTIYCMDQMGLYAYGEDGEKQWTVWGIRPSEAAGPAVGDDGVIYAGFGNRFAAISPDGSIMWDVEVGACAGKPAISEDGRILYSSNRARLHLFDGAGSEIWQVTAGGAIVSSPILDSSEFIYFGARDGRYYALSSEGNLVWSMPNESINAWLSGAVHPNGNILMEFGNGISVISNDGAILSQMPVWSVSTAPNVTIGADANIYIASYQEVGSYSIEGDVLWIHWPLASTFALTAMDYSGRIYVGNRFASPQLTAFDYRGALLWQRFGDHEISGGPVIGDVGEVYTANFTTRTKISGWITCNSHTGEEEWRYEVNDMQFNDFAIDHNGDVLCGGSDGKIYAVSKSGDLKWAFETQGAHWTAPAVDSENSVYIGSDQGILYAISSDGVLKWEFAANGPIHSSPIIGSDGTLYFGSNDGNFYAIAP